jgi:hypothetical protein
MIWSGVSGARRAVSYEPDVAAAGCGVVCGYRAGDGVLGREEFAVSGSACRSKAVSPALALAGASGAASRVARGAVEPLEATRNQT